MTEILPNSQPVSPLPKPEKPKPEKPKPSAHLRERLEKLFKKLEASNLPSELRLILREQLFYVHDLCVSQENLQRDYGALEKRIPSTPRTSKKVTDILEEAQRLIDKGEISITVDQIVKSAFSNEEKAYDFFEGLVDYFSGQKGQEILKRLRSSERGKTLLDRITAPIRKAKFGIFVKTIIAAGAVSLLIGTPILLYTLYKQSQSTEGKLSARTGSMETILKEGPKTPEEKAKVKGFSDYLVPAGKYVTDEGLKTKLELYPTPEELENIEKETGKIPEINNNYNDLLSRVGHTETSLLSTPTSESMRSANESLKTELTGEITRLRQEYEASSTQDKTTRADYEEKLAFLTQKLSKLEDERQKQADLQLQQDLEFFLTPPRIELYPSLQPPSSQPASQTSPEPEYTPEYQPAE